MNLKLSCHARKALNSANIRSINKLISMTDDELFKYRFFGRKVISEIRERLIEKGLGLGKRYNELS